MKFGKIQTEEVDKINFQLPADHPQNRRILKMHSSGQATQIYVGCPIWVNKKWIGSTYPPGTKDKDFLKHYTRQFSGIELNSTHYGLPNEAGVKRWKQQAQRGFKYSPKFLQEISHRLLMEGKAQELSKFFCDTLGQLDEYLGLSFLQLPPYFSPKDWQLLETFLDKFPSDFPLSIEFRHPDWFQNNHLDLISNLLEAKGIALVLTDVAGRRDVLHMRLTAPKVLIRFVGYELHPSDYSRCDAWIGRLMEWMSLGMEEIYFFVHQPDNDLSPDLVRYFIQELNQRSKLDLKVPQVFQQSIQGSLF